MEVLVKSYTKHSNEEKLSTLKKVIDDGLSMHEVAVEFAFSDRSLLKQWVHRYKTSILLLLRKRDVKPMVTLREKQLEEEIKQLKKDKKVIQEKNLRLHILNEYTK